MAGEIQAPGGPKGPAATGRDSTAPRSLDERSMVRRRASDPRAGLGAAGYALALQVSHPVIAGGVRDHSTYAADPWGRFFRTADFVMQLAYGDDDTVRRLGEGLRNQHRSIRGTDPSGRRYSALQPAAYAWVHATLGIGIVRAHDKMGTTFTARQRDSFWADWLVLGDHLLVNRSQLPTNWAGVEDYLRAMIEDVLEHNDQVDAVKAQAGNIEGSPPTKFMPEFMWRPMGRAMAPLLSFLGTGMLPPVLRERFRLSWNLPDAVAFRAWCDSSKAWGMIMPRSMRQSAPRMIRMRRGETGPFGVSNRGARLARG
ncbi:MAG: oxygenase MpaB family protein [Microthrixaceae bacterium]